MKELNFTTNDIRISSQETGTNLNLNNWVDDLFEGYEDLPFPEVDEGIEDLNFDITKL